MAESAIVFDTASTLAEVAGVRALPARHLLGGAIAFGLVAYHMAPAGAAVSKPKSLQSYHLEPVAHALSLTSYHMAGVAAPITPSGNTSVERAFSIPVFEFGEDVGGTVDFTVE